MTRQHFRGVVWGRGPQDNNGGKVYRYVIVGMVVTSEPLENLEGKNEVVLDGHAAGIADAINTIVQRKPSFRLGDANSILLNLEHIVGKYEEEETKS